jgi:FAD:protein FMN transferase
MGTLVEIAIQEPNNDLAQKAINKSFNEISRLEKIMSTYLPNSELSKLNSLAGEGVNVPVTTDLLKVIQRGVYWGKLSNGAIDISIGPATKLWEFNSEVPSPPNMDKLKKVSKLINYKNIIIEENLISFKKTGMSLNLGSIAKGYAVDQAIKTLKKMGIKSGFVNAGGDLMAFGLKSKTEGWHIGLQHPRKPEKIIASLDIKDKAVATSGDYQRYFIKDNVRYHHILNPKNGWPANQAISATVISNNVMDSDALSTALFILGEKKGLALINSIEGIEGMVISKSNTTSYSSNFHKLPKLSLKTTKTKTPNKR